MVHIRGQVPGQARGIAAIVFLTAVAVSASGCTKGPPPLTAAPMDAAGDVSSADQGGGGADALIDSRPDIPPDTQPTPPMNVRFPEPPDVTCAAVSDCEFPPSVCADPTCDGGICPGSQWVVYYDSPDCVAAKCVFEQRYFQCSGVFACQGGGCRFNGTAVAAP